MTGEGENGFGCRLQHSVANEGETNGSILLPNGNEFLREMDLQNVEEKSD